jgi:hypothetical protein
MDVFRESEAVPHPEPERGSGAQDKKNAMDQIETIK